MNDIMQGELENFITTWLEWEGACVLNGEFEWKRGCAGMGFRVYRTLCVYF